MVAIPKKNPMIPRIARSIDPFRPPGATADIMITPNETITMKIPISSIKTAVVICGNNAITIPKTIASNPRRTNDPHLRSVT